MPYVHLRTDRMLTDECISGIREAIADVLHRTLNKEKRRCMVQVDAAQAIALCGGESGCAFVEVRIKGAADGEAIRALGAALNEAVSAALAIDQSGVYINLLQMTGAAVQGEIL